MMNLTVGMRVFNGGDMANAEHFGTITKVTTDRWGTHVEITPDSDSDRTEPYTVEACIFSPKYLGHGGTRFVTEEAYKAYREAKIAEFKARYKVQG